MFDGVVDTLAAGEWFISTFINTTDQELAPSVVLSWHKAIQWILWSLPMISSEMMAKG